MRSAARGDSRAAGDRADGTMTAPSNTYDVIVVGGGISGRDNLIQLYFSLLLLVESDSCSC